MCAKAIEDIPLSELNESAYAVLSKHLDTLNPRRRDWKGIANAINLNLKETNIVEACNEHCKKLIEIWNTFSPAPQVKDLLEILEEKGCEKAMQELRDAMESQLSSQTKQVKSTLTKHIPESPQCTNIQVCGPTLLPDSNTKPYSPLDRPYSPLDKPYSPLDKPEPISSPLSPAPTLPQELHTPAKPDCTDTASELSPKRKRIQDGIFVSYHNNDTLIGEEIITEMKKRGINVYSEQDILAGDSVIIKREELFTKSKSIIAVITPDYLEEGYHLLEGMHGVIAAPAGCKRTFIPIIYKQTEEMPSFIRMRVKIYWDKPNKFDQLFRSISSIV